MVNSQPMIGLMPSSRARPWKRGAPYTPSRSWTAKAGRAQRAAAVSASSSGIGSAAQKVEGATGVEFGIQVRRMNYQGMRATGRMGGRRFKRKSLGCDRFEFFLIIDAVDVPRAALLEEPVEPPIRGFHLPLRALPCLRGPTIRRRRSMARRIRPAER